MKYVLMMLTLLAAVFMPSAMAQQWSPEQQAVWEVVEWTWADDVDWCAEVCHPDVLGWEMENPAPRNREQISAWWKRNNEASTTLEHQLAPMGIVIHGDTAVAHYYYTTLTENKDGTRETEHGKYTDVLVKDNGKWLYIAWGGGEQGE